MDGKSSDIRQEQVNKLKELFPEAVSEGKVDWEKLRLTLGEDITIDNERYVLNWAGKSDAFRAIQTPTMATLKPRPDQSVDFDKTENVFIEGENLEVLKVLQKSYYGRVKMIYIDPPYNTGNDSFIYPDKFSESKDEYLRRIGDKDEAGYLTKEGFFRKNSKENGQYHSNWLSMMYPRLFLARNLLRDDGVIFVSIDDNEVHNLRLMMNEIFGEENFVAGLVWQSRKGGGSDKGTMVTDHEYVLSFIKSSKNDSVSKIQIQAEELDRKDAKGMYRRGRELNKWGSNSRREDRPTMWFPIPGPKGEDVYPIRNDGSEGCWRWGKKKMHKIVSEGDVDYEERKDGTFIVYEKIRSKDPRFKPFRTWLKEVSTTADGSKELKQIFEGRKLLDFPKPVDLVRHLVTIGTTNDDDIVLDFFGGSGTTGQAIIELNEQDGGNRKFMLAQLPEVTSEASEARKAGYRTISDICKERLRRIGQKAEGENVSQKGLFHNDEIDTGFKAFTLQPSNFKVWRTDTIESGDDLVKQMDAFADPVRMPKRWRGRYLLSRDMS